MSDKIEIIGNYIAEKLDIDFYLEPTPIVAKKIIGKSFVRILDGELLSGIISETEAYLAIGDYASHSAVDLTKRNSAMFMMGSTFYVYTIYGIHHCINAVTESEGVGAAVLIRALEPVYGIELMANNRNLNKNHNPCKGPGNLSKALSINTDDNQSSLLSDVIFISNYNSVDKPLIRTSQRIGISKSKELQLRFELIR